MNKQDFLNILSDIRGVEVKETLSAEEWKNIQEQAEGQAILRRELKAKYG